MTVTAHYGHDSAKAGVIAALDIGSSKICCLIGQGIASRQPGHDLRTRLKVLGFGHTASRGVHAGAIADVTAAEKSIRLAVDAAEKMAGQAIADVYVGVTGGRPRSCCLTGTVETVTGVVSPRDIETAVAQALHDFQIGTRSLLHLAPVSYLLDGVRTTQPPLALHCRQLSVEIGVVTVESAYLRNISAAVERAHLGAAGFVMAPYAAAHGALVNDEMKLGTVLVELGGSLTSVGYFNSGHLVAADSIHLGGERITSDIALGFNTNLVHAERMKTLHGNLLAGSHDESELLPVPLLGDRNGEINHFSKGSLTAVIRPRMEEILEHVRDLLASDPFVQSRTARVVLAGGGSSMPGLRELAGNMLGRHVRVAEVPALAGLPETARQAAFSVATGLLCYGLSPDRQYALPQLAVAEIERQQMGYVRRVGRWLADAF
jgi:cell division protein FtsA